MVKHQQIKKGSAPPSTRKPMLTAGRILKARRNELGISLKRIADETKIRKDYLQMIEADDYSAFDSKVFVNGFIKLYADYVGLDEEKITALYRRSIDETIKVSNKPVGKKNQRKTFQGPNLDKLVTPQNVIITFALVLVLALVSYLAYQFYNFNKAPILAITSHETASTTEEDATTITGKTEDGVTVFINDDEINVSDEFTFEQEIPLVKGANTITIRAVKKSNTQSETIKIIEIRHNDKESDSTQLTMPDTTSAPDKYIVTVATVDGEAWISMSIDGKQEIAQILPSGYSEDFEMTEELTISSGRPSNTSLKINDQAVTLTVNSATGTAGATCTIRTTGFTCN